MSVGIKNNAAAEVRRTGESGARIEPRSKIFRLASLVCDGRPARAHILDIAPHGARLHCAAPIGAGEIVELLADTLHVHGEVMWAQNGRIGIRFDRKLSAQEVAELLS